MKHVAYPRERGQFVVVTLCRRTVDTANVVTLGEFQRLANAHTFVACKQCASALKRGDDLQ
jgi:hypothetical protein